MRMRREAESQVGRPTGILYRPNRLRVPSLSCVPGNTGEGFHGGGSDRQRLAGCRPRVVTALGSSFSATAPRRLPHPLKLSLREPPRPRAVELVADPEIAAVRAQPAL